MNNLLEIKNLTKSFGGLIAVNNVSFVVREGIIKSIIGPNGAGKTTLFNLISGFYKSDDGEIIFKNQKINKLKPFQIAKKKIIRTFQNIKLFSNMTVLENIMTGLHLSGKSGFIASMFKFPNSLIEEKKIKKKSFEILEKFNLTKVANENVSNLPFGQQRIIELARAYSSEPELLLLDEPAAGLNIYETMELAEIIKQINNNKTTILLVEHDMALVMKISNEIVVLNSGQKIAEDIPEKIQKNPEVIKIYLGEENA
ncbi:MAG TPA: ABC transporter ATP-binding protein [bacterium]|nr:ABC transporter ATP-binding protein [bacterium]